ncbi:hypothetical protein BGW80DRAFT_1461575 [Lactifluus volemus]|nr:hypothetical protein BGW80DRAFT_1461575 [Lactifluus volemus]
MDNTVAALEQRDRVHQIYISALDDLWEKIVTVMQKTFPALGSLTVMSTTMFRFRPLPSTFLNGSAPSLQNLILRGISFPSLPRLLSSTSDLTSLHLFEIPYSGYIPPEEIATSLSALPKLKSLIINFAPSVRLYLKEILRDSPPPRPPPTRFVLPALTQLGFKGVNEDLENLAARIDAPLLDDFQMTFFHWAEFGFDTMTEFLSDIPQTIRLIGPLDSLRPSSLTLEFDLHYRASISFPSNTTCHSAIPPSLYINCYRSDWQIISVTRICNQILPFCSRVKSLNIKCHRPYGIKQDEPEIDPILWSQLFHTFPSVQHLDISAMLESSIALALQGLAGESVAEVLPSLHSLFIVGNETAQGIALATGLWEQPARMTSSRLFVSRQPENTLIGEDTQIPPPSVVAVAVADRRLYVQQASRQVPMIPPDKVASRFSTKLLLPHDLVLSKYTTLSPSGSHNHVCVETFTSVSNRPLQVLAIPSRLEYFEDLVAINSVNSISTFHRYHLDTPELSSPLETVLYCATHSVGKCRV